MTPFVAALTRPSGQDPQAPLSAEVAETLRTRYEALEQAPLAAARDTCWRRSAATTTRPDFVLALGERNEDLIFLIGDVAIRGSEFRSATAEFLQLVVSIPLALTRPTIARDRRRVPRCNHRGHDPFITRCRCGVPDDFDVWASGDVCLFSNCYNFAVRDVWCSSGNGAQPATTPGDLTNADAWADILEPDGLHHVPDFPDVPADIVTPDGWHVALAVNESDGNYHFLRLDGSKWSHKFGKRPPQTCDVSGQPMPKLSLEEADLFGYEVVTYFWAPQALRIDH